MADEPSSQQPSQFTSLFDPHLILAVIVLIALVIVALTFSVYPPKLAGTEASDLLGALKMLTIMAFTWFFAKKGS
jgi:hypothetical protein